MTPERYRQVGDLFAEALELSSADRAAFLMHACGADADLRAEVEKMLAGFAEADDYFARPALEVAAELLIPEPPAVASVVGQQIRQYQVLSLLGAGGMGEVYLADDTRLRRKVALKLLPAVFTQDADRVRRFAQEAQAASALNHPNLLTIYDFGQTRDTGRALHYIATEYVEGQTLRQLVHQGPLPHSQVMEIALQLTDALHAAHTAGIIHRDIKPENVMLRPDGYVKVLDFGLAKLTETRKSERGTRNEEENNGSEVHHSSFRDHHSTMPGKVMGTISYMSPEQALGKPLDGRTDIFSLGVMLYELLTGVQPFKGNSEAATYDAILNRQPPPLPSAQASPAFAAVLRRALAKDPNERYPTAADMNAALKGLPHHSTGHSVARAGGRWTMRRRVVVTMAVLLVLVSGGYLWRVKTRSSPTTPTTTAIPKAAFTNVSFAQQTDLSGQTWFPTLSPDGKTLIYASRTGGNWDLWQQTVGQRDAVNLTKDSAFDDTQPAFAPDGKRIAFRSERAGGGLFVMELATRTVKKICGEGFNPTWSPGGEDEEIAYGTVNILLAGARSTGQIWAVRVRDGLKRLVVEQDAVQPAWSPNGKRIAFWRTFPEGNKDLLTIPASGGVPVRITNDAARDWNPAWSGDGQYLYFTSDGNHPANLWRVALDDTTGQVKSEPEPALDPAVSMMHVSIARNGQQLAYAQSRGVVRLQSLSLDPVTGTVHDAPVAIAPGQAAIGQPHISPDGQWLAVRSAAGIFVMHPDGTALRQVATGDSDSLPRWSPDGKRVAFFANRAGKNEIWAVSPDTPNQIEQLTFFGNERPVFPYFSPNGNQLAYAILGKGSFLLDLHKPWEQQTPQPLSIDGRAETSLGVWDWSPDGKKLACYQFASGTRKSQLVVYTLATPEAPARMQTLATGNNYPTWLRDSQRLIVVQGNQLFLVDSRTNATRPLHQFAPHETPEYLTLAPDNRTLYFNLTSNESDIWIARLGDKSAALSTP